MIYKSPLISQASGSLAGTTWSRNRGGMYLRARAMPTNPNSPQQQALRAIMAMLTTAWRNELDADEREAWETYAANVPLLNKLGEPKNVTGLNMFVRSNMVRLQAAEAGLTRIDAAPTVFNLGSYTAPSLENIDESDGDCQIAFTAADAWNTADGGFMAIFLSRGQDPTIRYYKGPYRYAGIILGDTATPPTSPATITLPFAVAAGQTVFAKVIVGQPDGRTSSPFRAEGTAAA